MGLWTTVFLLHSCAIWYFQYELRQKNNNEDRYTCIVSIYVVSTRSIAIFFNNEKADQQTRSFNFRVSGERFSDGFFVSQHEKGGFYGLQDVCAVSLLTPEKSWNNLDANFKKIPVLGWKRIFFWKCSNWFVHLNLESGVS